MIQSHQMPSNEAGRHTDRQRWLLVFNCQSAGLGSCLTLLSNQISVDSFDPAAFKANEQLILGQLEKYDRILIAPGVERNLGLDLGNQEKVWRLPTFYFSGFHPDHCNLIADGGMLGGPLSGNFSVLSFAAYQAGIDERRTVQLFREDVYERMGYLDQWDVLRSDFIDRFEKNGFGIASAFVNWSRKGVFAHVPSHPKVFCLRDIARSVLRRARIQENNSEILPHDNLANGVIFPVYPEIGSRIGVRGDYLFKAPRKYELFGLEEFIAESFRFFRSCSEISPTQPFQAVVQRAISVIGAAK